MKNLKKILWALALLLPIAACTPEEITSNGNNGSGDHGSTGLTMAQVVGTWESTRVLVNDEQVRLLVTITMREDSTGYLDDPDDSFHFSLSGMQVIVSPSGGGKFTFTVDSITATNMVMHSDVIPGSGEPAHFKAWFQKK